MILPASRIRSLRLKLDKVYQNLDVEEGLASDPLGLIDKTLPANDFEVLSFLAAGISYGRVEQIQKSFRSLLLRLESVGLASNGAGIYSFLLSTEEKNLRALLRKCLKGWVHRLNTCQDLEALFVILSRALRKHSSLAKLYISSITPDPEGSLVCFSSSLASLAPSQEKPASRQTKWRGTGPEWFFANPKDGSSCKRLLMWMRWMCRRDAIDPGTWSELIPDEMSRWRIKENYLFWPVDTHILKWALQEELVTRKTSSWKLSRELSELAKQIAPEDPIKYDFALCHSGMLQFRGPRSKQARV